MIRFPGGGKKTLHGKESTRGSRPYGSDVPCSLGQLSKKPADILIATSEPGTRQGDVATNLKVPRTPQALSDQLARAPHQTTKNPADFSSTSQFCPAAYRFLPDGKTQTTVWPPGDGAFRKRPAPGYQATPGMPRESTALRQGPNLGWACLPPDHLVSPGSTTCQPRCPVAATGHE